MLPQRVLGNIRRCFLVVTAGKSALGIWWLEARDTACYVCRTVATTNNGPVQNIRNTEMKETCCAA